MLRRLAALVLAPVAVCAATAAAWAFDPAAPSTLTAQQAVSGTRLAALADKIAGKLVTDNDKSLSRAYAVVDQHVPLGTVTIEALTPQVNPTYIAVPLQIDVDGKAARTVVAGYRVQLYIHTAVTTRDIAPGEVLHPEDLTTARVLSNGRPAVGADVLVGRKINSATPRGAVVYVEQTSVAELVKAGAGVILIVHDGPVSLVADVIARTGGGLGETVTVYNAQTNKILSGTVVGQDRVELDLPGENAE